MVNSPNDRTKKDDPLMKVYEAQPMVVDKEKKLQQQRVELENPRQEIELRQINDQQRFDQAIAATESKFEKKLAEMRRQIETGVTTTFQDRIANLEDKIELDKKNYQENMKKTKLKQDGYWREKERIELPQAFLYSNKFENLLERNFQNQLAEVGQKMAREREDRVAAGPSDLALLKPRMVARERVFAVLAVIFFLLAIALLTAFLCLYFTTRQDEVCKTPGCIQAASVILSSMNSTVDPCVDFYEYACGLWIKNHPIPDGAERVSNFEKLNNDLEFALKELLEDKTGEPLDTNSAIGKAKLFYRLCLNESEIFDNWRETFDEVVKSFGGWPSLGHPLHPDTTIERLYADMVAKFRAYSLFEASVYIKNSEKHVLLIDQPELLLVRDFYVQTENEKRLTYLTLIQDVLVLLKAEPTRATQNAEEIIEFETALANITRADEHRHDIAELYTTMSLGEMRRMFPNFDWLLFFNHVFQNVKNKDDSLIVFNEQTEVVVYDVEFLKKLDQLLPKFDKRIIINYLEWYWFFRTILRDLPGPFAMTLQTAVRNVQKFRWHACVMRINSLMPMATSSIYVQQRFDHEAKEQVTPWLSPKQLKIQVEEMASLIMEAFVDLLVTEDWLTQETKKYAIQKARTMKQKIGYPDYLNDSSAVDKEYAHFKVYKERYYKTKFQFIEQYQRDALERINQPVDRERWLDGAAVVNGYYSLNTNEIIIPAGILQPVFYSKDFPSSMKFGGIGFVIGRSVTYGFDNRGRFYDNMGNKRQWWDNLTIAKFEEKAECIEKQYSEYLLEQISMKINGRSTKRENIADNGGLRQAYKAYKKYEKQHPSPPRLPGVNLSHDQLFFLHYAQFFTNEGNSIPVEGIIGVGFVAEIRDLNLTQKGSFSRRKELQNHEIPRKTTKFADLVWNDE